MPMQYCATCSREVDDAKFETVKGRDGSGKDLLFCDERCFDEHQKKHGALENLGGGKRSMAAAVSDGTVGAKKGGGLKKLIILIIIALAALIAYFAFSGKGRDELQEMKEATQEKLEEGKKAIEDR